MPLIRIRAQLEQSFAQVGPSGVLGGLGRNGRGDWLQIVFGGKTGWVMWQKQMILFGPYTQLAVLAN